jgi:hypothetical protein
MATGIAGHNRGKKFVKGVGYVSPESPKPKVKEHHCNKCGVVLVGTQQYVCPSERKWTG